MVMNVLSDVLGTKATGLNTVSRGQVHVSAEEFKAKAVVAAVESINKMSENMSKKIKQNVY